MQEALGKLSAEEEGEISASDIQTSTEGVSVQDALDATACVSSFSIILLSSAWSDDFPYTQTVLSPGLTEGMEPFADLLLSDVPETAIEEQDAWGLIGRIDVWDGYLSATCYSSTPNIDLNVRLKNISGGA